MVEGRGGQQDVEVRDQLTAATEDRANLGEALGNGVAQVELADGMEEMPVTELRRVAGMTGPGSGRV